MIYPAVLAGLEARLLLPH